MAFIIELKFIGFFVNDIVIKINRNVTRKRQGNINNKISTRHETRKESTRFKFNVIVAWWSRNGFTRISGDNPMLRHRRSKNFPQRRYSPSFLSLNAHYRDACTAIHSSTWLLIESIDIARYTRTSFLRTIFTGARSSVYWSIECYYTWMLLKRVITCR